MSNCMLLQNFNTGTQQLSSIKEVISVFISGLGNECCVTSVPWKVLRALLTTEVSSY
jgi:hypothetical protein